MKKNYFKILLISLLLLVLFSIPYLTTLAQNQSGYVPLAPLPGINENTPSNLPTYANAVVKIIIGIAGVLAVIMIMVGGIQYMSTDAISGKEEGKDRITKAIMGLVLAIAAFLILQTISPDILNLNLQINSLPKFEFKKDYVIGPLTKKEDCERRIPGTFESWQKRNPDKIGRSISCVPTGVAPAPVQWYVVVYYVDKP